MSDWNGFRLGGMTAKQLNILQRAGIANPILPDTRERVITIPGRTGAYDFGAKLSELRIIIPCVFVYANTQEQLEDHIDILAGHLLDEYNRPRYLDLEFENNKGKVWQVRYSGSLGMVRSVIDGEFDLSLMAPDPIPEIFT